MKRIVCDLCDGTEFIKKDGVFICQGCGTKYSLAEARSIMQDIEEDTAPVAEILSEELMCNPNQSQIDNILVQARNAYEMQDYIAAENYCNRVIALDAMCYRAWSLKGKAVGRQSKINNSRIKEIVHSFRKAIDFAPEDKKEDLEVQALKEVESVGTELITLHKNRFANCPDEKEQKGFIYDKEILLNGLQILLSNGDLTTMLSDYLEEIATLMYEAGIAAFVKTEKTWANLTHPSHKDLSTHLEWNANICEVFRQAITLGNDDERKIVRYKNLINALRTPIGRRSEIRQWDSISEQYDWIEEYSLDDDATSSRVREAFECESIIKKLEKRIVDNKRIKAKKLSEEKQARIKAFWEIHSDEKIALDTEKNQLMMKKDQLSAEIDELNKEICASEELMKIDTSFESEKKWIEGQISDLENRRSKLGLFAGKEKKQIGEEITALEKQLISLNERIEQEKKNRYAEIEKKLAIAQSKKNILIQQMSAATKRITEIDKKLTKGPME